MIVAASLAPAALQATRRDALGLGLAAAAASSPLAAAESSSTTLANGQVFPLASFGLQFYDDATAERLTRLAIEAGFRNFFASALTQNQRGFARGVKASGIARDELFICGSVVSNRAADADAAYKQAAAGCAANLDAFAAGGIDQLDMLMLVPQRRDTWPVEIVRSQWRALEAFRAQGGAKSLAVSRLSPAQLDALPSRPVLNYWDYCVGTHDPGVVAANKARGIHVQAMSPLGNGKLTRFESDAPEAREVCAAVGARHGKSACQVALRWVVQSGASFTVAARSAEHFADDLALFDWALDDDDMARLGAINKFGAVGL